MIVTCPQCSSRFLLSAQVLGADGRKVKCSSCGEVWFQEPDEETLAELAEESDSGEEEERLGIAEAMEQDTEADHAFPMDDEPMDDIPDAVKPDSDEPDLDFVPIPPKTPPQIIADFFLGDPIPPKQRAVAYGLAGLIFFFVLFGFTSVQKSLVHAWPASAGFYRILGIEPDIPGKGLIFDDVVAEIEGDKIRVKGQIINLYKQDRVLPQILATVHSKDHKVIERWVVEMPEDYVPKEKIVPFSSEHSSKNIKGGEELSIEFVLRERGEDETRREGAPADQDKYKSKFVRKSDE